MKLFSCDQKLATGFSLGYEHVPVCRAQVDGFDATVPAVREALDGVWGTLYEIFSGRSKNRW